MIVVSCESCNAKHRVDAAEISSTNSKMQCKECGHLIPLEKYLPRSIPKQAPAPNRHSGSQIKKVDYFNSLQVRVNSLLIILIIVIMGAFTAVSYVTAKKKMDTELQSSSINIAKRLSIYLLDSFWSLDDDILQESLKSEMTDRNIMAINLFDRSGKKIYLGYTRNADWQPVKNTQNIYGKELTKVTENFVKDGKSIGKVDVFLTPKFFKQEFVRSMYRLMITSLLLLIAVTFAVYTVMNRMILSPISKLTNAADQISLGNLELDIPVDSKDEIGVLAEAFTRMKVSMVYAIKQLKK